MFFFPSFFIKANCIFMILGVKFIDLGINCKKKKKNNLVEQRFRWRDEQRAENTTLLLAARCIIKLSKIFH